MKVYATQIKEKMYVLFNWQKYKENISKVFTNQRKCIL